MIEKERRTVINYLKKLKNETKKYLNSELEEYKKSIEKNKWQEANIHAEWLFELTTLIHYIDDEIKILEMKMK